ncbi:alpha/beta hydrolase [Planococcus shixiaomingii]|uniref:alpha/beta hydrolase n=1 Tax=Planococcus shixiaomingii TaxID=3058393 RepID=UPI002626AF62|nr:alpha/beta hydrolase [Planococcus sp. N022]WKA56741.1 alpha/beta hydrolase [Planococcus sp. N022]
MMEHIFKKGFTPEKPVFLLLHGTGGNEQSLLSLAPMIDAEASVLSVRGNVSEHGMPRFFRRLSEGVFDEEDLVFRTKELNDFLDEAAVKYEFKRDNIVAIGYSNGANIAASLLYHYGDALNGAILHHPMVPLRGIALPDLTGKQIFIAAGTNDPISPVREAEELQEALEAANASVAVHWENHGHQLTGSEVEAARQWYQQKYQA